MEKSSISKIPEVSFYIGASSDEKILLVLSKLQLSPRIAIVTDQKTPSQFRLRHKEFLLRLASADGRGVRLFGPKDLTIVSRSDFERLVRKSRRFDRIVFENFDAKTSEELLECIHKTVAISQRLGTNLSVVISADSEEIIRDFEDFCDINLALNEGHIRFLIGTGSSSVRYVRIRADSFDTTNRTINSSKKIILQVICN